MKGIYITQQKKEELEAKIAELETIRNESSSDNNDWYLGRIKELKEILSEAIVLPVEESWSDTPIWQHEGIREHFEAEYPIGVIIKPNEL